MSEPADSEAHILVVSDDPNVRAAVEFGFPFAAQVSVVTDAREALTHLVGEGHDLVIVDLQTGSAGGFALLREMQSSTQVADVPVVMLLERPQDVWLARQAGAVATRVKPIGAQSLADVARSALGA